MDYYARCNQEPILKRNVSINYLTVKPKSSNYAEILIETGPGIFILWHHLMRVLTETHKL